MVRYAKESGCCDHDNQRITLTEERSVEIVDAGLDRIISIEGMNEKQYLDFSGYRLKNFQEIVDNVANFYKNRGIYEMIVKINEILLLKIRKSSSSIPSVLLLMDLIESVMSCWPEFQLRDGVAVNQERGIYGQPINEVSVCSYPFYSFSINPEGTASSASLTGVENY